MKGHMISDIHNISLNIAFINCSGVARVFKLGGGGGGGGWLGGGGGGGGGYMLRY